MKLTGLWIIARFEEGVTLGAAGGPGRAHAVSRLILACRVDHNLGALYQNCPILCWLPRDSLKLCGIR